MDGARNPNAAPILYFSFLKYIYGNILPVHALHWLQIEIRLARLNGIKQ